MSLSPGKDGGDKMSPYPGLQLYPQHHQPQLHRSDEHSENMDLCKCSSTRLCRPYSMPNLISLFFSLPAWGPNDPNFKLTEDTSDRGKQVPIAYALMYIGNLYNFVSYIVMMFKYVLSFAGRSYDTAAKERRRAH